MDSIKKGFTLIELLIVIGIIAILATTVLLVLNPGQILAETRDTQRLSDLDAVRGAINLAAFNDASLNYPAGGGSNGACSATVVAGDNPPFGACTAPASPRSVDGTGWMKINLGTSPSISVLPIDPTNSGKYNYHYKGSGAVNGTFELDARLESTKHRAKMQNDGGNANTCTNFDETTCWYEVGTKLDS